MPAPIAYDKLFSSRLPPLQTSGGRGRVKYELGTTFTDPDTYPIEELWQAAREALRREGKELTLYPPPQGHPGLRQLIAEKMQKQRGFRPRVEDVFLSSGAAGAINAILDVLVEPGDVVLAEEFTYLGTLNMLLSRRAHVVHVPTDERGMDTEALEQEVRRLTSRGVQPKLIFTISVHQNPMGMTMDMERRRHMLRVAQEYGVPILEDEVYADLTYEGKLPPAMYGMDEAESVLYVSSFSKLAGCGVRLGFGVAPPAVLRRLAQVRYGGAPSHLAAMTVHEFFRQRLDEHIEDINASLRVKRDAMLAALGEHFPPSCTWSQPAGGMHVWVRLPEGADTAAVEAKALDAGIRFNPGPMFHSERAGRNYLRLTYSYNTPEEIREGVGLLARLLEREGLFGQ